MVSAGISAAQPNQEDHPQIPRFPNSELVGFDSRYYDQAFIPIGQDISSGQWIAGNFQWRAYRAPAQTSAEALFLYFDQILGETGFKVVHACIKERCGENFFYNMLQASIRHVSNLETWVNDSAYYMAVRLQKDGLDRWVSLLIYNTPDDIRPLIRLETVDVSTPRQPTQLAGTRIGETTLEGGEITLAVGGSVAGSIANTATFKGTVERKTAIYDSDVSPSELSASWLTSSKEDGFTVDFYCGGIFCGPDFITQARKINLQFSQNDTEVWKANSAYYFTALKNTNGTKTVRALLSYLQADGNAVSHFVEVTSEPSAIALSQLKGDKNSQPPKLAESPLLEAMYRDGKIVVNTILFKPYTAEVLDDSSYKSIAEIAAVLIAKPSMSVYVDGHTDNHGSDDDNLALSLSRAKAVVNILVNSHNIDPERLQARGFGEDIPIISNHTAQGRAKNQRIEFVYRTR